MNQSAPHPRDQLVATMNRIYRNGMTTLSGGNLSILAANGDIWITPSAVDKGRLRPGDMICVSPDGRATGPHPPSSELPFHRAIYEQRPDLRAIVHAHAPALVSFSLARRLPPTRLLAITAQLCDPPGYAPYALTGSDALGEVIAATFAAGHNIVILENHGAVAAGATIESAYQRLEMLEIAAQTVIAAGPLGELRSLDEAERALAATAEAPLAADDGRGPLSEERALLADLTRRAVQRKLFSSRAGTASLRLSGGGCLITPPGRDRAMLDPAGMVAVSAAGDHPLARLHLAIYAAQPHIGAIMQGQSPAITAYAVSGAPFDTRTIPESYVLLRGMPRVPFADVYTQPERVAARLTPACPVLLLENAGVLATGDDLLAAFDRLEVAEFSARSLLDTAVLGPLQPIGAQELADLKAAFALED